MTNFNFDSHYVKTIEEYEVGDKAYFVYPELNKYIEATVVEVFKNDKWKLDGVVFKLSEISPNNKE